MKGESSYATIKKNRYSRYFKAFFFLRCYLPLKRSKIINVYAIASRNETRAREASQQWDIPVYYDSYEAILTDKKI